MLSNAVELFLTHLASSHAHLLEQKRVFTQEFLSEEFNSQRIGLGRRFIGLDTNMVDVTSCENTQD